MRFIYFSLSESFNSSVYESFVYYLWDSYVDIFHILSIRISCLCHSMPFCFPVHIGPVCIPQSVCVGYHPIPEGLQSRPDLPEHHCNDNLRKPGTRDHVWQDERLHRLIPKQRALFQSVAEHHHPFNKGRCPPWTCFSLSNILILCSVLCKLICGS